MGVPPSGTAGNAHELWPQPAPSGSGSAGKALKGEKLHFYFHFISEASSGVSQALEGILKGGGGVTKKSFFFHLRALARQQWHLLWQVSTETALSLYPEANSSGKFTPEVNSCRWEPLSSPWRSSQLCVHAGNFTHGAHSCFPLTFPSLTVTVTYCCHNWMILNFMFNILILKQTPAFISYQYHPQVPPKASSAPRGPLAPHLGYGPSSGASSAWWNT